jgi:uncharacterized protein YlzI (FlbEa/FlbD family)
MVNFIELTDHYYSNSVPVIIDADKIDCILTRDGHSKIIVNGQAIQVKEDQKEILSKIIGQNQKPDAQ